MKFAAAILIALISWTGAVQADAKFAQNDSAVFALQMQATAASRTAGSVATKWFEWKEKAFHKNQTTIYLRDGDSDVASISCTKIRGQNEGTVDFRLWPISVIPADDLSAVNENPALASRTVSSYDKCLELQAQVLSLLSVNAETSLAMEWLNQDGGVLALSTL